MSEKPKRDLEATKEALAAAAKELMTSCADCDEVTSRAIAQRAGVNPAMINYCYGSREGLLYEVFRLLLKEALERAPELGMLMNAGIPAKERLIRLHAAMMRLMIENFSYSRAVTKYILLNRSADFGMESLPLVAEHFSGSRSEAECRLITFELASLHELAVLRHTELKEQFGLDLADAETLEKYVRSSIDRYLV